jgi:CBS domain-containing protein
MSYLVKSYMQEEVPTIEDAATIAEAAKMMVQTDRGVLVVLSHGQPVGIVTEHDFVHKVLAKDIDASKVKVEKIMSQPLVTVDPDADLLQASRLMREKNIRRLPVVKDGIIYGIVTSRDIATHCGEYVDRTVRDIVRWAAPLGT